VKGGLDLERREMWRDIGHIGDDGGVDVPSHEAAVKHRRASPDAESSWEELFLRGDAGVNALVHNLPDARELSVEA